MSFKTLVINPGSTSTKIAIFEDQDLLLSKNINYADNELHQFEKLLDQKDFRIKSIEDFMADSGMDFDEIDAYVGRGGLMKPIPGGTYQIDSNMIADLMSGNYGLHASNLGAIIANYFAELYHKESYVVDPVVVDEFTPLAYLSGYKSWDRRSVFHALNQKAVARKALGEIGLRYNEGNAIVAHLGGGISVGAHRKGRVIDVNNGLDGDGTFSPNRTGSVSAVTLIDYIYDKKPTRSEVINLITHKGGLKSYLGTDDLRLIEENIAKGDTYSKLILDGLIYQISKEIGKQATVLNGEVDVIAFTGGMARSDLVMESLTQKNKWIAPIQIYPGEMEMQALNMGVQRVLKQIEPAKNYVKESEDLENGKRI